MNSTFTSFVILSFPEKVVKMVFSVTEFVDFGMLMIYDEVTVTLKYHLFAILISFLILLFTNNSPLFR